MTEGGGYAPGNAPPSAAMQLRELRLQERQDGGSTQGTHSVDPATATGGGSGTGIGTTTLVTAESSLLTPPASDAPTHHESHSDPSAVYTPPPLAAEDYLRQIRAIVIAASSDQQAAPLACTPCCRCGGVPITTGAGEKVTVCVNTCDPSRRTSLQLASQDGNCDAVRVLLQQGADSSLRDKHGMTALTHACCGRHVHTAEVLLKAGANSNENYDGTAVRLLMLAFLADYIDVAELLLRYGADVNRESDDGDRLLLAASRLGRADYVNLFLSYSADYNVKDVDGWTALQISAQKNFIEVADLLRAKGATLPEEKTRIESLDGYDVISVLGKGAYGKVFKVHDPESGEFYALKQIYCVDEDQLHDALSEVKMLQAASHPGIVKYHKSYKTEHESDIYFCVVMELCPFGTLQTYMLSNKSRYDDREVLHIAKQICDALQFLHAKGTYHRDLKPSNIFLTATGHLKLGDFGFAMTLSSSDEEEGTHSLVNREATTRLPGTPLYMSPEVFKGRVKIAKIAKVDMWGLGVTLLEVCGVPLKRPRVGGNLGFLLTLDERKEHARLRLGLEIKGFAKEMADFIISLLMLDPDRRPSATEVLATIDGTQYDGYREVRMRSAFDSFIAACEDGDIALVRHYLEAGADSNARRRDPDGSEVTGLYAAAREGRADVAELLLHYGARVGEKTLFGQTGTAEEETALMVAVKMGHFAVALGLLENVTQEDASEVSRCILVAADEGNAEILPYLVAKGGDVNVRAPRHTTPLMLAVAGDHQTILADLLHAGANPNLANRNGSTALMLAAELGNLPCVRLLLAGGADPGAVNAAGDTALSLSSRQGHTDVSQAVSCTAHPV